MIRSLLRTPLIFLIPFLLFCKLHSADHLFFKGQEGPGKGKHLVFLAGDEEYRSEEGMPLMAQILNKQGFDCTVLFSLDNSGFIDSNNQSSLSHPEALDSADAIIMLIRFRNWNDSTMQKFENALMRGVPFVALRTSTHAFNFPSNSKWAKYSFNSKADTGWTKGFGREVLGETWVSHHGKHKKEGCRSTVENANAQNSILNGVGEIFVTSDVYGANPPSDSTILLRGLVTETLEPNSAPVDSKNNPAQPIAWTRLYKNEKGKTNRIFTTTMGASTDLLDEDLRRLVANAIFWGLDLKVPQKVDVTIPGVYQPSPYSFNGTRHQQRPEDYIIKGSSASVPKPFEVKNGSRIVLFGNGLASRMAHYGHFETELQIRYPNNKLYIRNMADEGNTPSFRPHSGRKYQLGFPGAEKFFGPYADGNSSDAVGHFETEEQWLTKLKPDILVAFFGFNASFLGEAGIANFKAELDAFLKHTLAQKYNGKDNAQFALVSPTAFENLTHKYDVPNGVQENKNLARITKIMADAAAAHNIPFVNAFEASKFWYANSKEEHTTDGALLNDLGYQKLATLLSDTLFGKTKKSKAEKHRKIVHQAVMNKNWFWINDFKMPNGVHVFGRRYKPFGPDNYPDEIKKIREMTEIRDIAIWDALQGKVTNTDAMDAKTHKLPEVKTNFGNDKRNFSTLEFFDGDKALSKLKVPEGYKIEQFATEKEFPDLANPVQMSFDNKGRLWVATMPSYPHYRPGDPLPDDKLIILEDTDGDGKADKQTTWADKLHLPMGFEISDHGVYVSQGINLVLLKDTDGDDYADYKEVLYGGFDDHDTHHAIGAYSADPSGAMILCEGVFLRSNVETPYGPIRGTNGGFFRYDPNRRHLERHAQLNIPNPWGVTFDAWGQHFFLYTSGTTVEWMLPGTVKPRYGIANPKSKDLIEAAHKVRPTSGIEFLYSRHFPDEVQGDMLLNNNIGYLGTKQHQMMEDGTGYSTKHRYDLVTSEDGNFRPVDLEIAPDGSLYIIDWHNPLIGHMQHNARDPNRDHAHGRVYRITYPSRPLVKPAKIAGASIQTLLDNLKLHEYRSRYRTRRELRGRKANEVLPALKKWVAGLDKNAPNYEHHKLEALWVTWGLNQVDEALLKDLLSAKDHKTRAAAVRVLRYNTHKIKDHVALLKKAATDEHGRVIMEAVTAASWIEKNHASQVLTEATKVGASAKVLNDDWLKHTYSNAVAHVNGENYKAPRKPKIKTDLKGQDKALFMAGAKIYAKEGHCETCHQHDGNGLAAAGFPPLAGTKWVNQDPERLIKITLNGLHGPIEVKGKKYPGQVPMTPFAGMLNDHDIAAVLTFVKNSFGNKSGVIKPEQVKKVRAATKDKVGFYSPEELLKQHPHK